jgi:hypothetical protein
LRKIVVFAMVSLDGVMQAPGSPEEDTSAILHMEAGRLPIEINLSFLYSTKN